MNKYVLGDIVIETTQERYENTFKDLGYKPFKEAKINDKEDKKREDKIEE